LPGDITPDECQDFCVNFPKTSGQRNCASGCGQDLSAACRRAVFINTLLDFVFIPLYVWFLLTFVVSVIPRGKLRVIAILFALSAGICDVIEDIFILLAVNSRPVPIFIPSLAKWAMIGLTVAVIGRCLIRDHDIIYSIATDRLLGLAYLASGLLLLFGVAAGEWFGYSWIQHGAAIFAAAFLISGIYVVAYCVRRWLPGQLVRYIDNFCEKRESGEPVDVAVRAEPQ
jgi:hypothetical protein